MARETIEELDWDWLMSKTEGFVAKDLDTLVSRAIHAYVMSEASEFKMCHLHRLSPLSVSTICLHYLFPIYYIGFDLSNIKVYINDRIAHYLIFSLTY